MGIRKIKGDSEENELVRISNVVKNISIESFNKALSSISSDLSEVEFFSLDAKNYNFTSPENLRGWEISARYTFRSLENSGSLDELSVEMSFLIKTLRETLERHTEEVFARENREKLLEIGIAENDERIYDLLVDRKERELLESYSELEREVTHINIDFRLRVFFDESDLSSAYVHFDVISSVPYFNSDDNFEIKKKSELNCVGEEQLIDGLPFVINHAMESIFR